MIVVGNKITPSPGYKYVTNGEVISKKVYLGAGRSADAWHDTNEEPSDSDELTPEEALAIITGGARNEQKQSE